MPIIYNFVALFVVALIVIAVRSAKKNDAYENGSSRSVNGGKAYPVQGTDFSLKYPFSQAAIDFANSLPDDIQKEIDKREFLVGAIKNDIERYSYFRNPHEFSHQINYCYRYIGVDYDSDYWEDYIRFESLGYNDVHDENKLSGIVYAIIRKVYKEALCGNEKVECYWVEKIENNDHTIRNNFYRLHVRVKPADPGLKDL